MGRKPVIRPQNMPKQLIGGRNGQNYGILKWAHGSSRGVFGICNMWEATENLENEAHRVVTRRLYFFFLKEKALNGHFSRPAETDPYMSWKCHNHHVRYSKRCRMIFLCN